MTLSSNGVGIDIGGTSVKAVHVRDGVVIGTGGSDAYARPDRATIEDAVETAARCALGGNGGDTRGWVVGVCVPGILNADVSRVVRAVNLPGLSDVDFRSLMERAVPGCVFGPLMSDAIAAAHGYWSLAPRPGRMLMLSLGTGVGAAVLDDGVPLRMTRSGAGHFGQIDVGVCGPGTVPIGPDGGRGSLEAYVGVAALRGRFGEGIIEGVLGLPGDDAVFVALARAIRIGHAMFAPDQIVLLGGIGTALKPRIDDVERLVREDLTSVAAAGWSLKVGDPGHYGAVGAVRLGALFAKKMGTNIVFDG
jgi:glucokinase